MLFSACPVVRERVVSGSSVGTLDAVLEQGKRTLALVSHLGGELLVRDAREHTPAGEVYERLVDAHHRVGDDPGRDLALEIEQRRQRRRVARVDLLFAREQGG